MIDVEKIWKNNHFDEQIISDINKVAERTYCKLCFNVLTNEDYLRNICYDCWIEMGENEY